MIVSRKTPPLSRVGILFAILALFVLSWVAIAHAQGAPDPESIPILNQILGTGVALGFGYATKKISKAKGSVFHKIGSPLAATVGGIGAAFAAQLLQSHAGGGIDVDVAAALGHGLKLGMSAVFAHSVFSGGKVQLSGKFG